MPSTKSTTLITSSTTIDTGYENFLIDATSGSLTITLPIILSNGQFFRFRRIDNTANNVTITGTGQNIDGNTNITLPVLTTIPLLSYSNEWYSL